MQAFDADSGKFGEVTYALKGFGSDKYVHPLTWVTSKEFPDTN